MKQTRHHMFETQDERSIKEQRDNQMSAFSSWMDNRKNVEVTDKMISKHRSKAKSIFPPEIDPKSNKIPYQKISQRHVVSPHNVGRFSINYGSNMSELNMCKFLTIQP